ncbi:MAG: hypothetical protein R3C15_20245 [Thermoleophilia bacterium]
MTTDLDIRTCELCGAQAADTLIVGLQWRRLELSSGRPVDVCPDCAAREDWPRLLFTLDRVDERARAEAPAAPGPERESRRRLAA